MFWQGKNHRYSLGHKQLWLLILFLFLMVLSTVVHFPRGIWTNLRFLMIGAITFGILYGTTPEEPVRRRQELHSLCHILLGLSFLFSAITVLLFCFGFHSTPNTGQYYFGIYFMPSMSGILAASAILVSVHMLWQWKALLSAKRVFLLVQIALQLTVLTLANARSAMLVLAVMLIGYLSLRILVVWQAAFLKKVLAAAVVATIVAAGVFFIYAELSVKRMNEQGSNELRINIISQGWETFMHHPALGVSPANVAATVLEEYGGDPADLLGIEGGSLHNSYLEVLTGMGIFSFLALMSFFLCCARLAIGNVWALRMQKEECLSHCWLVSVVAGLAVFFLFENMMLFSMNFTEAFFWICLGFFTYSNKE